MWVQVGSSQNWKNLRSGWVGSSHLTKNSSQIGSGFKPSKNKVETGRVVPGQPVTR